MDAKKFDNYYRRRLAEVMKFREALPIILRVGEELQVSNPSDMGIGHIRWENSNFTAEITISDPSGPRGSDLNFTVKPTSKMQHWGRHFEAVKDPSLIEKACRSFFEYFMRIDKVEKQFSIGMEVQ